MAIWTHWRQARQSASRYLVFQPAWPRCSRFFTFSESAYFNAQWMHIHLYGIRLADRLLIWPCHLQHAYRQFVPTSKVQITERCLLHEDSLQYSIVSKLHWPSSLNEGRSYYCSSSFILTGVQMNRPATIHVILRKPWEWSSLNPIKSLAQCALRYRS
jgi:hypothetical protein